MQFTEQAASDSHVRAYTVREFDTTGGKKARAWTRIGVSCAQRLTALSGFSFQALPQSPDIRLDLSREHPPQQRLQQAQHAGRAQYK